MIPIFQLVLSGNKLIKNHPLNAGDFFIGIKSFKDHLTEISKKEGETRQSAQASAEKEQLEEVAIWKVQIILFARQHRFTHR